jgi:hypothetical protein
VAHIQRGIFFHSLLKTDPVKKEKPFLDKFTFFSGTENRFNFPVKLFSLQRRDEPGGAYTEV